LLYDPCAAHQLRVLWSVDCSKLTWPSLFIIGPASRGADVLSHYLSLNPRASRFRAHGDFFTDDSLYFQGLEYYARNFPRDASREDAFTYDTSTTYLSHPLAASRVFAAFPGAFIIVIITDPVERALSWYHQYRTSKGELPLTTILGGGSPHARMLRDACFAFSTYRSSLQRWYRVFPRKRILLVDEASLLADPATAVLALERIMKITARFKREWRAHSNAEDLVSARIEEEHNMLKTQFSEDLRYLASLKSFSWMGRYTSIIQSNTIDLLK